MKISRYTFIFTEKDNYYLYNTLSNAFIEIDSQSFNLLKKLQSSKADFKVDEIEDKDLLKMLVEKRIVTTNNKDEFLLYKSIINGYRNSKVQIHLTIAPTMDCNYSCPYCFEKKKETYITTETIDSIIKYVEHEKDLSKLHLTWFGGEPLLAINKIEEFYDKLKKIWTKDFSSNIITNGFLISSESLRILKKAQISFIQITLDGKKEYHNKMKFTKDCNDTFSKTIDNIDLLLQEAPEIKVVIRINLNKENATDFVELNHFLTNRYKDYRNIFVVPAFIMDTACGSNCNNSDNIFFSRKEKSDFNKKLFYEDGIITPFIKYPEQVFPECAIRNPHSIAFDPEGYAYKCWEIIGDKKYAIGVVNDKGHLANINKTVLNRYLYGADPLNDKTCSSCSYLPICGGGCPHDRLKNEFDNKKVDTCTCKKGYLEEFLKMHLILKNKASYKT